MEKQRVRSAFNIHEEKSDNSSIKMRKSEDTIESDESESQKKKKKGIIDLLPMKKQRMKSAANTHEGKSDDSSIK